MNSEILRYAHVACGAIALVALFFPLVSQKGGKLHRRAGWIYVCAMAGVVLSSFSIGYYRYFVDPQATDATRAFALFLVFIGFFATVSIYYGLRVLRAKKRTEPSRSVPDIALSALLIVAGVSTSIHGWRMGNALLMWFPLIGIFLGAGQLGYLLTRPADKMHWWYEHMTGMISGVISTITAFLVTGFPRLVTLPDLGLWLWFAPTIVLTPLLFYWQRKYRIKFEAGSRAGEGNR